MHAEATNVHQLFNEDGKVAIVSEHPTNGDKYMALFNIADEPQTVTVDLTKLGYISDCGLVNLWTGEDSGQISGEYSVELAPHASALYKLVY